MAELKVGNNHAPWPISKSGVQVSALGILSQKWQHGESGLFSVDDGARVQKISAMDVSFSLGGVRNLFFKWRKDLRMIQDAEEAEAGGEVGVESFQEPRLFRA